MVQFYDSVNEHGFFMKCAHEDGIRLHNDNNAGISPEGYGGLKK
jgi:hypothetical protein